MGLLHRQKLNDLFWKILFLPKVPKNSLPTRAWCNKGDYTWEDFDESVKKKCPIRFKIHRLFSNAVDVICRILSDIPYWLRTHTYNRYHIVDIRQPKNSPDEYSYRWGYIDDSRAIVLANFTILCNFVENEFMPQYWWEYDEKKKIVRRVKKDKRKTWEKVLEESSIELDKADFKLCDGSFDENNYNATLFHRNKDKELLTIYKWWKIDRFELCKREQESFDMWMDYKDEHLDKRFDTWTEEESKEDRRLMDEHIKCENERDKQEEEVLIRLMKIRHWLST